MCYINPASQKPSNIGFSSDFSKKKDNQIKLSYGEYKFETTDIKNQKSCTIDFSSSCNDTLWLNFPEGGTVTTVGLHKSELEEDIAVKELAYMLDGLDHYIPITKAEIGKYYVRYGSCWWGGEFWLTIK